MAEETRSVEEIRRAWNKPAENTGVSTLVGTTAIGGDPNAGEEADEGYSTWSKKELLEEIDARNEAMGEDEEPLSKSGNKDELVARLEEHDATQEPAGDEE